MLASVKFVSNFSATQTREKKPLHGGINPWNWVGRGTGQAWTLRLTLLSYYYSHLEWVIWYSLVHKAVKAFKNNVNLHLLRTKEVCSMTQTRISQKSYLLPIQLGLSPFGSKNNCCHFTLSWLFLTPKSTAKSHKSHIYIPWVTVDRNDFKRLDKLIFQGAIFSKCMQILLP
jgi:hypothetical protein